MLEKNKIAQKRERRLIEVLSIFCVFVFMSSLFHNITLCYDLGKDDTETFIWLMIPESVAMLLMVFCSALIFKILFNLKHKRVFIRENARLVQFIGLAVMAYGTFLGLWKFVSPVETIAFMHKVETIAFMHNMFLLLGAFFVLIGSVFKAGIRIKEEQDLTI